MPEKPADPVQMMDDVIKAFATGPYAETRKALEDSVERPLDPVAHKLTGAERRAADAAWLGDPLAVLAENDTQAARFGIPKGFVSKRVWKRVLRAVREAE